MKQSRFYILFFFVVCIGLFCSCLSNDDDAQWSKFNGVYVTVGGCLYSFAHSSTF